MSSTLQSKNSSHAPLMPVLALKEVISRIGHLLPAQGPINVFVHHNTLHAFEHQPFEDAVVSAGHRFGCEPFLSEDRYRSELRRGRIGNMDVEAVLRKDLQAQADDLVLGNVSRYELRRRVLVYGIPQAGGTASLEWLLSETDVLRRFRMDLPGTARGALLSGAGPQTPAKSEATFVRELWLSCQRALGHTEDSESQPKASPAPSVRHRDVIRAAHNIDIDEQIHPVLIRLVGGFLDQGLAHWPMPERDRGLYPCFLQLHGHPLARLCGPWSHFLKRMIDDDRSQERNAWTSLRHSLDALGIHEGEWESFLSEEALALRGWAGMMRQVEKRPDLVPVAAVPARLVDFLAVRLLFTRAVLKQVMSKHGLAEIPLAELRTMLSPEIGPAPKLTPLHRAWRVFHVAQLCGLNADAVNCLSKTDVAMLETEISAFPSVSRRRILHLAFERHLRHRFYDALVQHESTEAQGSPHFQAIFCLDEREESFRRHLEEVDPHAETYGAAGFYGVAIYFRGTTDAHPRALCPVAVEPKHYVAESAEHEDGPRPRWHQKRRRFSALVHKNIHVGSQTFTRGAIIMATIGVLWVIPLMLRVLFPRLGRGLPQRNAGFTTSKTRLQLDRNDETPPIGKHSGYTVEEMARIVHAQLAPLGILSRLAPLVFVFGHGSRSLNNPQESAHDCGACGGGRGGPNARAFAQMANDPRVRAQLVSLGAQIPDRTWFIGGQRNTASNDVVLYDEDLIPQELYAHCARAKVSIDSARHLEAHERCRRFTTAPSSLHPQAALLHVQARAADLAQPRPEYGHASNAVCIIGRRARTKGLFLDRRAFLTSYDPTCDPNGELLTGLLAAVVPVVVGINLEYYFGYTDPTGYGCGTKLPHNVAGLLGVMDGAQSDLRTGLPWQMLEIHEPVRLTIVVETPIDMLRHIVEQDDYLNRLVQGRWLRLASLHPATNVLHELDAAGAHAYAPEQTLKRVPGPSLTHYRGQSGHLPFVQIDPSTVGRVVL